MLSLIICTKNRIKELRYLFESLKAQTNQNFEVLLIDQNDSNILNDVVSEYQGAIPLKHIKSEVGLSLGRNIGLKESSGAYIGFPDDDCIFKDNQLIEKILDKLNVENQISGISIKPVGSDDGKPLLRFPRTEGEFMTLENVWTSASSITIYFRRNDIKDFYFNESLGLGTKTPFRAGEETDFLIRLLRAGKKIKIFPSIEIHHPSFTPIFDASAQQRAFDYGMGLGRTLKINQMPNMQVALFLVRPFLGMFIYLCRMRFNVGKFYYQSLKGRLLGYFSKTH